ncbi:hypothetical protein [Paenibacillus silvestris]|nr:hypothetical protein [Paenibacillus silvestris]
MLTRNATIASMILLTLLKYGLIGVGLFIFIHKGKVYLSNWELVCTTYLLLFLSPVIGNLGLVKRVLAPVDEILLSTSPLSNRQIFLFNYTVSFVTKKLPEIPFMIILTFVVWYNVDVLSWSFWIFSILLYVTAQVISFCLMISLCLLQVNRYRKGYRWGTFLYVMFCGMLMFFISFFISKTTFSWLTSTPNIKDVFSMPLFLKHFFQTVRVILQFKQSLLTPDLVAAKASIYSLDISLLLYLILYIGFVALMFAILFYYRAGFWYRTSWRIEVSQHKDWLWLLERIFLLLARDIHTRIQIKQLLRNRLQIASDYAFFFFNYFNYLWIGIAAGLYQIDFTEHPLIRLISLFMLFNIVARDSFGGGVIWFPGMMKFDSDGRALQLYRISGENLIHVYKAKIRVQRWLGSLDFLIMFSVLVYILKPSLVEWPFIISLCAMNFFCIPHLKTIPSLMFPRLTRQHYTENEDYLEATLWQENIEKKTQQIFFLIGLLSLVALLILHVDTSLVYWIGSLIYTLCLICGLLVFHVLLERQKIKSNEFPM